MALEISSTMSKFQLKLADRQCRMAELSQRCQDLITILATSLYGGPPRGPHDPRRGRRDVPQLSPQTPRPPPIEPLLPPGDRLGADIAAGGFPGIAGLAPDEILMRYEQ